MVGNTAVSCRVEKSPSCQKPNLVSPLHLKKFVHCLDRNCRIPNILAFSPYATKTQLDSRALLSSRPSFANLEHIGCSEHVWLVTDSQWRYPFCEACWASNCDSSDVHFMSPSFWGTFGQRCAINDMRGMVNHANLDFRHICTSTTCSSCPTHSSMVRRGFWSLSFCLGRRTVVASLIDGHSQVERSTDISEGPGHSWLKNPEFFGPVEFLLTSFRTLWPVLGHIKHFAAHRPYSSIASSVLVKTLSTSLGLEQT